jgi:hypothetical protein
MSSRQIPNNDNAPTPTGRTVEMSKRGEFSFWLMNAMHPEVYCTSIKRGIIR